MLDILSSLKMILLEHKAAFFLGVLVTAYPFVKRLYKKLKNVFTGAIVAHDAPRFHGNYPAAHGINDAAVVCGQ